MRNLLFEIWSGERIRTCLDLQAFQKDVFILGA
nr:MAG TPA: hypothetical protein [Caudoviricetes sp.]DAN83441.1 MAG TPA: hypothetical protein [Caudoviricetes sp.]